MNGIGFGEIAILAGLLVLAVLLASVIRKRPTLGLEESMAWPAWTTPEPPPVLMRVYAGRGEQTALLAAAEARRLAIYGYMPVSQSVTGTSWRSAEWLACIVLTFAFGLGILLFLFYTFVEPASSLLIAYERRAG